MAIFVFALVWMACGLIAHRMLYYSLLHWWYKKYKEDLHYFNNGDNVLTWHAKLQPLALLYGPFEFLLLYGVCYLCDIKTVWYFELPKPQ